MFNMSNNTTLLLQITRMEEEGGGGLFICFNASSGRPHKINLLRCNLYFKGCKCKPSERKKLARHNHEKYTGFVAKHYSNTIIECGWEIHDNFIRLESNYLSAIPQAQVDFFGQNFWHSKPASGHPHRQIYDWRGQENIAWFTSKKECYLMMMVADSLKYIIAPRWDRLID